MKKLYETFVTILAAISVVVILIDLGFNLTEKQRLIIYVFDFGVVVILALDFYFRLRSSKYSPTRFVLKHWYEILAMIPIFVFDVIGTSGILGVAFRSIRLIRLFRVIHLFSRVIVIFRESRLIYLAIFSSSVIIIGAVGEYIVESPVKDAKITNFGDAVWWAMATVTTVGYGDMYPITLEGKIIGSIVMILGISILGISISTLGVSLIESRLEEKKRVMPTMVSQIKELVKSRIDEIEKLDTDDFNTLIATLRSLKSDTNFA